MYVVENCRCKDRGRRYAGFVTIVGVKGGMNVLTAPTDKNEAVGLVGGRRTVGSSKELFKVKSFEPSDLLEGGEELASLVNVNLTGLLCVGLTKWLGDTQGAQASLEDAALAAEVLRTAQAESLCNFDLRRVEQLTVRVVRMIVWVGTGPFRLQRNRAIIECRQRW